MPYGGTFIPYIVHCQAFLSIYGTIYGTIYMQLYAINIIFMECMAKLIDHPCIKLRNVN